MKHYSNNWITYAELTTAPKDMTESLVIESLTEAQGDRGHKVYELSNHLGNVLATVSDKKLGQILGGSIVASYYEAQVQSASDYYPFGWVIPSRKVSNGENYRFGFNGKENDSNYGNQLIQDYGFRIYNPSIGRFLSVDPLSPEYPELTPYQFASNSSIAGIDLDGLEFSLSTTNGKDAGLNATYVIVNTTTIKNNVVEEHVKAAQKLYSQILTREGIGKETSYYGNLSVAGIVNSLDDVKDGQYYVELTDVLDERLLGGKANGASAIGGMSAIVGFGETNIGFEIDEDGVPQDTETYDPINIDRFARTFVHEVLHNAGLFHPWVKSNGELSSYQQNLKNEGLVPDVATTNIYIRARNDLKNGIEDSENVRKTNDNIMNSAANPDPKMQTTRGTKLNYSQIQRIHDNMYNKRLPREIYTKEHVINPPKKP